MSNKLKSDKCHLLHKSPLNDNPIFSPSRERKPLDKVAPFLLGAIAGNIILPGLGGFIVGGVAGASLSNIYDGESSMKKVPVFYSFHFDNDVMRVQQVRNIGTIEGNSPTTPNEWEQLKRTGKKAVENWIDQNMKYKRCVIVLIGKDTANRHWVNYEIKKAWEARKPLLGIYIHNLKCPRGGVDKNGQNPFDTFHFNDGKKLSSVIPCYDPNPNAAYKDISENISFWIDDAIKNKAN